MPLALESERAWDSLVTNRTWRSPSLDQRRCSFRPPLQTESLGSAWKTAPCEETKPGRQQRPRVVSTVVCPRVSGPCSSDRCQCPKPLAAPASSHFITAPGTQTPCGPSKFLALRVQHHDKM
ncbi:unnamed protein product [Rangifer tarandus platyrhynchus]|uniref:Uncharacterized protein n=1 Tax=Rangifer tarandus platyrhynchus TaxID=3082113 RepID=A0AC59ZNT2_RANTA